MKIRNSKRGSYIIEASVVLPVTVLSVLTAVLIVMFFFSQAVGSSRMHIYARSQAHSAAGNTVYTDGRLEEDNSDISIAVKKKITSYEVYADKHTVMINRGILERKEDSFVKCRAEAVDSTEYVRVCNMIKGKDNE